MAIFHKLMFWLSFGILPGALGADRVVQVLIGQLDREKQSLQKDVNRAHAEYDAAASVTEIKASAIALTRAQANLAKVKKKFDNMCNLAWRFKMVYSQGEQNYRPPQLTGAMAEI